MIDVEDYGDEPVSRPTDKLVVPKYKTIVTYRKENDTLKTSLIDLKNGELIIKEGVYDKIRPSDRYDYIVGIKGTLNEIVDYDGNVILPFQKEEFTISSTGFISWGRSSVYI